jgi:antitoxin ParD1/3/4
METLTHTPTSMNVSLPPPLRTYVEQQVASGLYGNSSEFIRELVRQHQKQSAAEQLDRLLIEGLASSESKPWTKADESFIEQAVAAKRKARLAALAHKAS